MKIKQPLFISERIATIFVERLFLSM